MKQDEFLTFARRMRAAGIRLHIEQDDDEMSDQAPSEGLLIRQVGGWVENGAFVIPPGWTGFRIFMRVTSNLPGNFAISRFGLELPWEDPTFSWLEDPEEFTADPTIYRFPGKSSFEYPRELVINHFADVTRTMSKGQSVQGLLLALGGPMPDTIKHGEIIPTIINVYSQFDRKFSSPVSLWVDRSQKRVLKSQKKASRRNLLDHPDPGYERTAVPEDEA